MFSALRAGLRQPRLAFLSFGMVAAALASVVYASGVFAQPAPPSAAAGAAVFAKNCQVCHGVNAQGRVGVPLVPAPPDILAMPRDALVQQITGLLRAGIPTAMPAFPATAVSDSDVTALIEYLLDLSNKAPADLSSTTGPDRDFLDSFLPVAAVPSTPDRTYVAATGHTLAHGFKAFWEENNGLRFLGYPITEEYIGVSDADGKYYTMQMFERGRLEYHPEFAGTPNDIQLGLVGSEWKDLRTHFVLNPPAGFPPEGSEGPGGPPSGGPAPAH